ncbi:hypothetical protein [Janthinobacterium sp. RB2R34]|uniref:hypothetical protein n=1 Tax=Janthinobacterium sp. RB2R34 TaxID=3424193 RepID=UPI003F2309F2
MVGDEGMFGIRYSDIWILSEKQINSIYLNIGYLVDVWEEDKAVPLTAQQKDVGENKKGLQAEACNPLILLLNSGADCRFRTGHLMITNHRMSVFRTVEER